MTYLGVSDGGHGNIYMRSNNAMFTATHAVFDEKLFPRCKSSERHRSTRLPDRNPDPKDPIPPPGDDDVPIFHQPTTPQMRQDPEQDVAPPVPAEQPARDPSPPPQPRNEQPPAQEQLRRSGRVRRPPTRLTGDPRSSKKVIKNCWVFDVKSDGRKKACLVVKGFSQIEGLDDQVFSPVVWFETV
ncbi:reverse transcriptase RNA-dependent DNA partial [Lentinula edodes]|uniref:Reverse transcriptase RNA-dependent DNA partial n=1 Tax=Lentinula edodes TaxID=5353 RepID=A0A1Q3ESC8_LENED|nr:reverse transcriptase RNA-dependent DNA partial [Lentinula edodes]